ncbi:hypothetical protein TrRE_jg9598 [Triparma retinervis]|uniref:Uncharacterized protein n=1 Tax=Triparma retinervis TaxID=2557542 RepID=A0A9W7AEQ3_9STRA|nr:hypothetical protein TrRE_jg9598 [Triparma retinervis]
MDPLATPPSPLLGGSSPLILSSSSSSSPGSQSPSPPLVLVSKKREGKDVKKLPADLEGNFRELKRLKVLGDKGRGGERLEGVEVTISNGAGDEYFVQDPTIETHRTILGIKNVLEVEREVERRKKEIRELEKILEQELRA